VIVGEPEIDFVDDQPSAPLRDRRNDALHFVAGDTRARRIRRRGDEDPHACGSRRCAAPRGGVVCALGRPGGANVNATRGRRPILFDQLRGELIIRRRTNGNADRLAFQNANEMARARIARIGEQNAVIAVHQQRVDQQQRRG